MSENLVRIFLAATLTAYEFKVSYDLTVRQAASLIARILEGKEGLRFSAGTSCDLMHMEGSHAGELLPPHTTIRSLVVSNDLVDGQTLALV